MSTLARALGAGAGDLVSLVGGGGKTSLMLALAGELCDRTHVIVTTTTLILPPVGLASSVEVISRGTKDGKLVGLMPESVDALRSDSSCVLCEADGAKCKPLKAWADHEPPVPGATTLLVAVVAADRLGEPMGAEHVHRMELMTSHFGLAEGDPLAPRALSALLDSPKGYLKNAPRDCRRVVFLNRCDLLGDERSEQIARDFIPALAVREWDAVVIGSAREGYAEVARRDMRAR